MPCKTKTDCYYGRETNGECCKDCCPREIGYNLTDDFDNMIESSRNRECRVHSIWTSQKLKQPKHED